ncbi:MAG: transketolase, partial [bacterium]
MNSQTGEERRAGAEAIGRAAAEMRADALTAIHAAGSGHPGGTLSILDATAVLYLDVARHDPARPDWPDRDRILFSAGHKAPALYAALAWCGYFPKDLLWTLRQVGSPLQGHPDMKKLAGVEVSTGSLGQGLGIGAGMAMALRLDGRASRVFVLMGDGEQQEGSVWEAAMAAAHHRLGNLVGVVDLNGLQIAGPVAEVMDIRPIREKYEAFGWRALEVDGHDVEALRATFRRAVEPDGRPTVVLLHTVKGKGVSFMENQAGWHGVATKSREQLDQALADVARALPAVAGGGSAADPAEVDRRLAVAATWK